ncbi:hypothetical protein MTQ01_02895 [Streptomyces sp. XM4193]|uniref:hypothetical protein n=1 Tax=Streptomyces sp. XM4193 TaxID=2929782 RepID=UPI001FFC0B51|nr:hypothetical protein [Streptomyces sp. XM4193]MCK1794985.1 hypothetical protein [Streptomyces sp. XM4193]
MAYLLCLAEQGKPKQKLRSRRLPRLSEMHLPVGGHRMRPSLEDVLLFLYREFRVNVEPNWREVVDGHLREYRRVQLRAAVRDAPEEAADVLRGLGYEVALPRLVGPRSPAEETKLYWP